jgi:hypothetical protein
MWRDTPEVGQRNSVSTTVVVRQPAPDDRGVAHYRARRALRNNPSRCGRGYDSAAQRTHSRLAAVGRPRGWITQACTERPAPDPSPGGTAASVLARHVAPQAPARGRAASTTSAQLPTPPAGSLAADVPVPVGHRRAQHDLPRLDGLPQHRHGDRRARTHQPHPSVAARLRSAEPHSGQGVDPTPADASATRPATGYRGPDAATTSTDRTSHRSVSPTTDGNTTPDRCD